MLDHLAERAARFSRRSKDGKKPKMGHVSGNPRYNRNRKHAAPKDKSMGRN